VHIDELDILLDVDGSEDPYLIFDVATSDGVLQIMGEFIVSESHIVVKGMHLGGDPSIKWGWSKLRALGRTIAEKLDVDYIEIHGAVRTTGANPGRHSSPVRLSGAPKPQYQTRSEYP